jgi:MFS transporter, MHS family, proline/betaine transporter
MFFREVTCASVSEMLSGTLTFGRIAMAAADVRKAVTGASIGNAVEWFDFAIYGFLATFIAANFFPSGNETAALLNTFAIFAREPRSSCDRCR